MNKNERKIIALEFNQQYEKVFGNKLLGIQVYDAPEAEAIVVIVGEDAWVCITDADEFVFWGPKKKACVNFPIPSDWPRL